MTESTSRDDAEPLSSAMALEAAGDTRPSVRKMAREQRAALTVQALREQAFALLWDRYGTGDDGERDVAWTWFNRWPSVMAVIRTLPRRELTPQRIADEAAELFAGDR